MARAIPVPTQVGDVIYEHTYPENGREIVAMLGVTLWVMAVASALGNAAPQQRAPAAGQSPKATASGRVVPGAGAEGQSYVGEAKCLNATPNS